MSGRCTQHLQESKGYTKDSVYSITSAGNVLIIRWMWIRHPCLMLQPLFNRLKPGWKRMCVWISASSTVCSVHSIFQASIWSKYGHPEQCVNQCCITETVTAAPLTPTPNLFFLLPRPCKWHFAIMIFCIIINTLINMLSLISVHNGLYYCKHSQFQIVF